MPSITALSRLLQRGEFLIADGALATELENRGCNLDDPLWSAKVLLEQPHLIRDVHRDYFRAGARVATTASYQATPHGFARRGIGEREALELLSLSARLADEARREYLADHPTAGTLLVAGSVGPYGAYLADGSEYRGDYSLTPREFREFHEPRITTLVDSGADFLAFETLPSYAEAEVLLELAIEFDVEAWFSFSLLDDGRISDGTPLTAVGGLLNAESRVAAIGVNCVPLHHVAPALEALRHVTNKPLLAYPNSGETYDSVTKTWSLTGTSRHSGRNPRPQELAQEFGAWLELGAQIIGGCCRTTPADIRRIRETS